MNIKKEATKVKKALRDEITLEAIAGYVRKTGYGLVFYNTTRGDEELQRYGLLETARTKSAFVYSEIARIVFVDDNLSHDDKTRRLLHELGHVVLGHLDTGDFSLKDQARIELEAQTFAYMMLDDTYRPKAYRLTVVASVLCVVLACGLLVQQAQHARRIEALQAQVAVLSSIEPQAVIHGLSAHVESELYITKGGEKYHVDGCRYLSNSKVGISTEDALEHYEPCRACIR